jgi:ABC-type lipoprotein release transport system permease subunit
MPWHLLLLKYLLWVVVGLILAVVGAVALATVLVGIPLSVALLGVFVLQMAGVLKGVPFSYNLRNLVVRWKTTALTGVAFTLVVALLTVMLAFVNGMYALSEASGNPSNVMVLQDGATDEMFSDLGRGDIKEIALRDEVLRDEDGQRLASWEVYLVVNQPILTRKCPHCGEMVPVDRFGQKLLPHSPTGPVQPSLLVRLLPYLVGVGLALALGVLGLVGLLVVGRLTWWTAALAGASSLVLGGAVGLAFFLFVGQRSQTIASGQECPGSGLTVIGSRGRRFVQVRGVEDPVLSGKVHGQALYAGGSWFSQAGVEPLPGATSSGEQAIQAVIGEGLARELGPDQAKKALAVGDVFDLGPRKWIVVGVMRSAGSTFDSEVWAKRDLVGQQFGKTSLTTCVLRTAGPDAAKALADDLSKNYKKPAVTAQPEPDYYSKLNTTNQQFLYAILGIMVIVAVGSIFGVMITMFAAISQRHKDIGVMRILGYARWQVLTSFFMESVALALAGGLVGCALGSLSHGASATSILSSGMGGGKSIMLKLVVDWRILAAGMGFSLLMGCLGGLVPALSAMRLKPLESVR